MRDLLHIGLGVGSGDPYEPGPRGPVGITVRQFGTAGCHVNFTYGRAGSGRSEP